MLDETSKATGESSSNSELEATLNEQGEMITDNATAAERSASDTDDESIGINRKSFWTRASSVGLLNLLTFASAPSANAQEQSKSRQPAPTVEPSETTSDILVETLIAWGATHVFGIVGDGINPIVEALRKRRDRIAFVSTRHEESAAFMVRGSRFSRVRVGLPRCRNFSPWLRHLVLLREGVSGYVVVAGRTTLNDGRDWPSVHSALNVGHA